MPVGPWRALPVLRLVLARLGQEAGISNSRGCSPSAGTPLSIWIAHVAS